MNYKKIKTWEDACKVHNTDPTLLPEVSKLPAKFQNWLVSAYKLGVITEAINTDEKGKIWIPDYNDEGQIKYFPWFEVEATEDKPSGVGFSFAGYDAWYTDSTVGSRFCFETSEQVSHAQKHFGELFIDFHLIK